MKHLFTVKLHHTKSCTLYLCHSCVFHRVCARLPGVVVTSRVPSSLRPGECVWGESCPWLSWTQMCWTACTRWDASETESSSHVICNVKSKSFFSSFLSALTVFVAGWILLVLKCILWGYSVVSSGIVLKGVSTILSTLFTFIEEHAYKTGKKSKNIKYI